MPPKNKIKKKKSKVIIEPGYHLLTMEEMKVRELKHSNQLRDLKKCLSFINDALLGVCTLKQQELLQDEWIDFVTCTPLPKPDLPTDIHRFYSKLEYMEKENDKKSLSWLLSINERSILSQDIHHQDLTRRKLGTTIRRNIGEEYNNYIRDSIEILRNIDNFLNNDIEVAKCPINILDIVVKRKLAIEKEIMEFLDRFTYRIISSENAEMKSIDDITAEYFFNALHFDIHIWCLKNVPIRFSHLSEPRMLANFHSINLLLQIPLNMLKENLVIRAVHMNFDHLSERTKSLNLLVPDSTENRNAGLLDLHDCLVKEWSLQMEIQAKTIKKMRQNRLEYEEKVRQYKDQLENNKKRSNDDKKAKKTKKIVKPTNEPLDLGSDMVPDIQEEFLQEEQKQYENFIQTVYKPQLLNLSLYEINLRKYIILGGIYQVLYIEKPKHIDFNSSNLTFHHNQSKLVKDENTKISPDSWLSGQFQMQIHRRFTRRMTVFEAETRLADHNIECPLFIMTIELPEYLCFWGKPIPCHFEETLRKNEISQPVEISGPADIISKSKKELEILNNFNSTSEDISSKLPADSTPADIIINPLAASQLIRRETFFQDSLANSLLNKRKLDSMLTRASMESLYINDFSLQKTLTKLQINHIERHILPRIISSYKFPREVQYEAMQFSTKKPKGKGGRIINQKVIDLPPKLSGPQFTFNDTQNNPERIFAKYPKVETVHILSYLREHNLIENQMEPDTFAELLQVVEDIKEKYRLSQNKISDLKPLERHITTRNKRIKQMLRNTKNITTDASQITKSSMSRSNKLDTESLKLTDNEIKQLTEHNLLADNDSSVMSDTEENEKLSEMQTYLYWTTEYILKSDFDRESRKIVLHTNRLGDIGFAFNRYEHFPFKYWSMEPSGNNPDKEVIFTLDTQHVRCVLYITASGIRGHITEPAQSNVRNPKLYFVIENPIKDFNEFKKLLTLNHLNIFAEHDASFYIENGCYSEKHLSNELHTYICMAIHSTQMHFKLSIWNHLAKRRDIILKLKQYQDSAENLVEVLITPGEAFFVETQELCPDNLDVVKLDYNLTWRNIDSYSDLHQLIVSMYPSAMDLRCKSPKLICFIRDILSEVRPLSFS